MIKALVKPPRLQRGDTVAAISLSGGRAGDSDLIWRYQLGKRRLQEAFSLRVVETPHALRGSDYLYRNPQARAEDLHWALENPAVKGVIANMGGDDSYRLLPFLQPRLIRENPKVLLGYSDITTTCMVFAHAGVMSYYGPNLLTPIAQPGSLDASTQSAMEQALFTGEPIGPVEPCPRHTPIEWRDLPPEQVPWTENTGYAVLQGQGKARGRLLGGSMGPLQQIMGTDFFPTREMWAGSILFLDGASPYGSTLAMLHALRALGAAGVFSQAAGLLTGPLNGEEQRVLTRFLGCEAGREDLPVLMNVDFCHRTPMAVLPVGALAEMDCEGGSLTILESGTA